MTFSIDPFVAFGYAATIFTVSGAFMRTMIPLRCFYIVSNICLIIYGFGNDSYPIILAQSILLPIHVTRLIQMIRLAKQVKAADNAHVDVQWLQKYGTEIRLAAGDVLFRKGDQADRMFYVLDGRYVLTESGVELGKGQILGELGLFSDANTRTQSLACREPGRMLEISYSDVKQLYYQNPEFGFYLLRLVSRRLFENIERLEKNARAADPDERLAPAQ